jgi:hypothetical protein
LELDVDEWNKLQFKHIATFPHIQWYLSLNSPHCAASMCFSCGSVPFHHDLSCVQHMRTQIHGICPEAETIKWKLANSKACPNCSTLITRDEGCNKVDCLVCGHQFCWHCLGSFENGLCGYYRCQVIPQQKQADQTKDLVSFVNETEIGVPNIMKIQARMNRFAH